MTELLESYLNKPIKVVCKDERIIYGILVCLSKPYSMILLNGVCYHPSRVNIDLQFHYSPQFASKPFLTKLDPSILNAHDNLYQTREKLKNELDESKKQDLQDEIKLLEQKTEQAKQHETEFMKDKYYIGSLVLPGAQIQKIFLIQ